MKIGIYSHATIDNIVYDDVVYDVPGGPACYCSLTARYQKYEVFLSTKFGSDFPLINFLKENYIKTINEQSEKLTTRFKIILNDSDRNLFIENRCDELKYVDEQSDGLIISPVYDEISLELFQKIKLSSNFVFLDPQGFLRTHDSNNKIFLKETKLDLSDISAIKVNSDELIAMTGKNDDNALKSIQKQGVEHVILTDKQNISLLVKDRIYSIHLPNIELIDTTGIGDIFSATFCCTLLKERDFLWALSFAAGAAQAALESKNFGLEKVPQKREVENNGSYFYNMVKFRQL